MSGFRAVLFSLCVLLALFAGASGAVTATADVGASASELDSVTTQVSDSRTLIVDADADSNDTFESIQAAIDAANESDTVHIRSGTYTNPIIIDKNITITAADGVLLTGSATNSEADGVTITGSAAPTISGLRITGFETGIQASGSGESWVIKNTTITNTTTGIDAFGTSGDWRLENTLVTNISDGDGDGVNAELSDGDWMVERTTITESGHGINADQSTGDWTIHRTNVSLTRWQGITADDTTGNWSVRTSILTQNYQSRYRIDRSITAHDAVYTGDATGNWWGSEYDSSDPPCVGNVVCTNPLQTKPDAGVDSTTSSGTLSEITLNVDTRFPNPTDPLSAHVDINATGPTAIQWYINGTAADCSTENCTLDVAYPANLSVTVTSTDGTTRSRSTVIRASNIELTATAVDSRKPVLVNDSDTVVINVSARNQTTQHEVTDYRWTVNNTVGPRTGTTNDTVQISARQDGVIESTLTYQLRDPKTGETETVRKTERVAVERLHTQKDQYTFDGFDNIYDAYGFAAAQDNFPIYHSRLSQRITSPPASIQVSVKTNEGMAEANCPYAGACAVEPNTILLSQSLTRPWGPTAERTFRHELVHLTQYELNAQTHGEWEFLAEGQAEFDSAPTHSHFLFLSEKPPLSELKDFSGGDDYINSTVFVSAFYAEYGRQAFLDLVQGSRTESLETEFEAVTGESLESFHGRWQPTDLDSGPNAVRTSDSSTSIEIKPMFTYQAGTLTALQAPDDVTISWDTDNDGVFERTGATTTWSPETDGQHRVTLRYERNGTSLAQTQILDISADDRFMVVEGETPTDPDNDGKYEDINGNDELDIGDVQALFANQDSDVVQNNVEAFDFNENGRIDIGDVQALFNER